MQLNAHGVKLIGMDGNQWKRILAAWSGWIMDGYVSISYSLVAFTIAPIIFGPTRFALVAAFLGVAVTSLSRIIGSLVFGNFIGDRLGRRRMLTITVFGFSIFGFSVGFVPTYSQVGYLAPVIMYTVLFFVGLFAGAEYGGGAALASESAPPEKRNFVGAFVQSGFGVGYFIVSLVYSALSIHFGQTLFNSTDWRYLFYSAIIPGLFAIITRFGSRDTDVFNQMKEKKEVVKHPMLDLFRKSPRALEVAVTITTGLLFINSATLSYYPTVMHYQKISDSSIGIYVALINLISLFGVWIGGILSLKFQGRRLSMFFYSSLFLALFYPLLLLGYSTSGTHIILGYGFQAFIEAMIFASLPTFLAETFSKTYRSTAIGFSYNLGAVIGGFAPTIISLFEITTFSLTPWAVSIFALTVVLIGGVFISRETWSSHSQKSSDVIAG
jgi:MFS family permease